MALESTFQKDLIVEIKQMFPGCIVLKNDSGYMQGIPDILILFRNHWAILEAKRSPNEPFQPNQEWYIETLNNMSFSSVIYPENKEAVLDALQHSFRTRRAPLISKSK